MADDDRIHLCVVCTPWCVLADTRARVLSPEFMEDVAVVGQAYSVYEQFRTAEESAGKRFCQAINIKKKY